MSYTSLIIVGAGKWGTTLISVALNLTQNLIIVDSNYDVLSCFQSSHPTTPTFKSLKLVLAAHEKVSCEAKPPVILATPALMYFDLARQCIINGHSVLIEKPMCTSVAQAEELVTLAEEHEVVLMVDHVMQYNFSYRRMIQMVEDGMIGRIHRVRMVRCSTGIVRLAENVLWSFLRHEVSLLLSLTGATTDRRKAVDKVVCHGQSVVTDGIEDYVNVHLSFRNGVQAHLEASWLHPKKERRTVVYGELGCLILNEICPSDETLEWHTWSIQNKLDSVIVYKNQAKVPNSSSSEIEKLREERKGRTLEYVLEEFLKCVNAVGKGLAGKPRTDGREALQGIRVLQAASESLKHNGAAVCIFKPGNSNNGAE